MSKYIFSQFSSSDVTADPLFGMTDFTMFGDPSGFIKNSPLMFEVYFKTRRFRYCLVNSDDDLDNKDFLLKTKRYLLFHENNDKESEYINTYFIGDMKKSLDISNGFSNQNIILVTYEMIEQWYPRKIYDRFKIIIQYILKEQEYLGQHIFFNSLNEDMLFVDPSLTDAGKREYKMYLQRCMAEEGLLSIINNGVYIDCVILTAKAISLVETVDNEQNKIAFIAIKFNENEERINTIQNAIAEAGFEPRIMNQVETNNWIMPEIFFQIKNSRFVVADFSLPCDGAYYEAGYAAALDKPVIHLFDRREESDTNKLHFDIAQKSTIFYKDYDDLKERLINRIRATIK